MDTITIMIILIIVIIIISISIYFMMSGSSESATSSVNWAGNSFTSDGRCGPSFGNKACGGKQCCSQFGWCGGQKGQNDDWCRNNGGFGGNFNGEKP